MTKIEDGQLLRRILVLRQKRELCHLSCSDVACLAHTTVAKMYALECGMHENAEETEMILSRLERSLFVRERKPAHV